MENHPKGTNPLFVLACFTLVFGGIIYLGAKASNTKTAPPKTEYLP